MCGRGCRLNLLTSVSLPSISNDIKFIVFLGSTPHPQPPIPHQGLCWMLGRRKGGVGEEDVVGPLFTRPVNTGSLQGTRNVLGRVPIWDPAQEKSNPPLW